jgi:hypothetical protein
LEDEKHGKGAIDWVEKGLLVFLCLVQSLPTRDTSLDLNVSI